MKKFFLTIVFSLTLFIAPSMVFAQGTSGLVNPLGSFTDTSTLPADTTFATSVAKLVAQAIGALAALSLIPIIIGGIYLISASGNDQMVKKGKDAITWGVIGLVLAISSVAIYNFVLNLAIR